MLWAALFIMLILSIMNISQLFRSYEFLADEADAAFHRMEKEHGTCIKCQRYCSDCCHAVFGLFIIEAAFIKQHFDRLDGEEIQEALLRCGDMERALKRLEIRLQKHEDDPQMQAYVMAQERIRCPLLNDNKDCILYPSRPITCRIYGVPTKIHGKARVCGKAEFRKGESYPAFDLDEVYRDLFNLSKELLNSAEKGDPEKASLLISVSKAISTPLEDIIDEIFG
jgi:Fe-S-cluster containining protein